LLRSVVAQTTLALETHRQRYSLLLW